MADADPPRHPIGGPEAWARANVRLLDACYVAFAEDGRWPRIETLEHRFEVADEDLDVGRLVWEVPRSLGFTEHGRLVLLCRALLFLETAQPLLEDWYRTVHYAYESWRAAPDDELISHEVVALLDGDEERARRVSTLLFRESWMFGSGTGEATGYWTRKIISAVRVARDAHDARELIAARAVVEATAAVPTMPGSEPNQSIARPPPDGEGTPNAGPGRLLRTLRFVSNNALLATFLGGLAVVGALALVGVVEGFHLGGSSSPSPAEGTVEQAGAGGARTFRAPGLLTDEGPPIADERRVRVDCKVHVPEPESVLPEGYWYKVASSPWDGRYFAPANSFWNGDVPGRLPYTHYVDRSIPNCT
jgi:hypothetical protein